MVVVKAVECSTDWQCDVRRTERPTSPHLGCETIHMPTWLQTTIQHRLLDKKFMRIFTKNNDELTHLKGAQETQAWYEHWGGA